MSKILVTGAGGFIGNHLVTRLKKDGHWVRGADIKYPEYQPSSADDFKILDLRRYESCLKATKSIDNVYNLAADMGGIGFITEKRAEIARNNVLINTFMLDASHVERVAKFLFSSSACVYPQSKQKHSEVVALREQDAMPADPEAGYGWEKLYTEQLCRYYREDYGLDTRVVRFHNVYGPYGAYEGGREKSPAAICRKVSLAKDGGEIEIWGDGLQTRSFMYVDDCVEGLIRIMASDYNEPLNLGTDRLISINELVDMVSAISGKTLSKKYDLTKPQGVRGRNSDNRMLRTVLEWEPKIELRVGLSLTYNWILGELTKAGRI